MTDSGAPLGQPMPKMSLCISPMDRMPITNLAIPEYHEIDSINHGGWTRTVSDDPFQPAWHFACPTAPAEAIDLSTFRFCDYPETTDVVEATTYITQRQQLTEKLIMRMHKAMW